MSWSFTPPPVSDLWEYWTPRFIVAGVDSMVIEQLKQDITGWDDWYENWWKFGEESEEWAEKALEEGNELTAGELLTRASILYHFAGMVMLTDFDLYLAAERKRVETFARGGALLPIPTQPISIPFQGVDMPGYLRVPPSDGPVPLVVYTNGWEGVKETTTATDEVLARGMATFTMDGPGIGETLHKLPLTGEYGPVIAATLDVLEGRDDIDENRMGVHGSSRGGLLAGRAAAYDDRIKALATIGPGYETRRLTWAAGMQELVDAFMQHLFHTDTVEEANERVMQDDFSLQGVAEKITCPTLIVTDNKAVERFEGSQRFYDEVSGPKRLAIVPGAQRNGARRSYLVKPLVADWLAAQLTR